ncbi:SigE family RNA polymerase sigma factor [Phycicoccus sonneratiae]|uniref:SigE family RNA polymerase sigma factor n=1 Tax=Phycicoccus sonneratiae TaxID=2807628 RepID=A0ABS2CKG0_9MICO|nr:SigE family RNA polymerase sigma factor [Phycicoccus sonneraticus]MBM6400372.1 SigE family RNA polymerase sigma factor [Phycicoccus sonneraticus]
MTRGADEEFADFVDATSPRLLRTAWLLCGDPAHAEDLVQAALERVYLRWSRLRDGTPEAYAHRTLVNLHIDHVRKRRREHLTDTLPDHAAPSAPGPEDGDYLSALLAHLPQRERQVVVLRHYVGQSEAETAHTLGVSVGTVKSSASRGLARLRDLHTQESSHAR